MVSSITNGIKVSVESSFRPDYSNPEQQLFIFSYHIIIENKSEDPVQLIKRHWYINDSLGNKREVKGDGVIGQQPIIEPGKRHAYESACDLRCEFGHMYGIYIMKNLKTSKTLQVNIPKFEMAVPYKLN